MQNFVITFISDDRPGLVENLSSIIHQHQGNWLESKMAQLSGKFTGIIEISLPSSESEAFTQALASLDAQGISVLIEAVDNNTIQHSGHSGDVTILGLDRPGIVNEISTALAAHHINVEQFHSYVEPAPMSAEPLFKADVLVSIPSNTNIEELDEKLEAISQNLDIECSLTLNA